MAKSERRKEQRAKKRAAKERRMKSGGGESTYARKYAWRVKNCGGDPLPFYPEVMMVPSHQKPWRGRTKTKAAA